MAANASRRELVPERDTTEADDPAGTADTPERPEERRHLPSQAARPYPLLQRAGCDVLTPPRSRPRTRWPRPSLHPALGPPHVDGRALHQTPPCLDVWRRWRCKTRTRTATHDPSGPHRWDGTACPALLEANGASIAPTRAARAHAPDTPTPRAHRRPAAGTAHAFADRRLLAHDPVMVTFLVPGVLGVLARVVRAVPAGLGCSARVELRGQATGPRRARRGGWLNW